MTISVLLCHSRQALLLNKSASSKPSAYPNVASWKLEEEGNGDCCSWDGVKCNEETGLVIKLDLSSSCLYGSINSTTTLFHLVHLQWLSLADNDFNHSQIPSQIINLSSLSHLNLSGVLKFLSHLDVSDCRLSGTIPPLLGNLTELVYLDLSSNNISGQIPNSLSNLIQLNHLDISRNYGLGQNSYTLSWMSKLTKLTYLGLTRINLAGEIPSWFMNLTQLTNLKMNGNQLTGQIPDWLMRLN
ncbi:hypothetical protein Ddye_020595 [Dipteronia dyeriana]|uniref:Leucine-rich repeat-containing N-terminal plant-type domain-containing protein n=1 Tax=Dipteronia dyeriana TaxID=168575 RepID=A0AAD9U132_9ROSI|nr:hypothetical protein Ddye_020595 [Dipteronia dyeriana]